MGRLRASQGVSRDAYQKRERRSRPKTAPPHLRTSHMFTSSRATLILLEWRRRWTRVCGRDAVRKEAIPLRCEQRDAWFVLRSACWQLAIRKGSPARRQHCLTCILPHVHTFTRNANPLRVEESSEGGRNRPVGKRALLGFNPLRVEETSEGRLRESSVRADSFSSSFNPLRVEETSEGVHELDVNTPRKKSVCRV